VSRQKFFTGFTALTALVLLSTACRPLKPFTQYEANKIRNHKPSSSDISNWFNADLKYLKANREDRFNQYRSLVELLLADFESGKPFKIKQPNLTRISHTRVEVDYFVPHQMDTGLRWDHFLEIPYTPIHPEFGIPIIQIEDCISVDEAIEISATERVLQWYAHFGSFPVNSKKR